MKNPWMSVWMSAWHRAANTARGRATAHASRTSSAMVNAGVKEVVRLWTAPYRTKPTGTKVATRKRRKS